MYKKPIQKGCVPSDFDSRTRRPGAGKGTETVESLWLPGGGGRREEFSGSGTALRGAAKVGTRHHTFTESPQNARHRERA